VPDPRRDMLLDRLYTYGADLARWPDVIAAEARKAMLADPAFRRAWEAERDVDRALLAEREAIDGDVSRSGAAARIRAHLVGRLVSNPMAGWSWRSIAAAVLLAGMLGSVFDLVLPEPAAETPDVAMLDPLEAVDGAGAP
jgi:hypothetical protein